MQEKRRWYRYMISCILLMIIIDEMIRAEEKPQDQIKPTERFHSFIASLSRTITLDISRCEEIFRAQASPDQIERIVMTFGFPSYPGIRGDWEEWRKSC